MTLSFFPDKDAPYPKYNNRKVVVMIKIMRYLEINNPYDPRIDEYRYKIFGMMRRLVEKNINNYIKFTTNSSVTDLCNNSLEMESEAFILFDNCLKHFTCKFDFYFYFNKSMSRTFYRMFDNIKRQQEKDIQYRSEKFHLNKDGYSNNDFKMSIFNLGLDEDEMIVLHSKLNDETKEMFCNNNPKFQMSKYYACTKKIKNLLTSLREQDEL